MKDKYIILISAALAILVLGITFAVFAVRNETSSTPNTVPIEEEELAYTESEDSVTIENLEEVDLPSTRTLLTQCEQYGYDSEILLPILQDVFGEGTINLDAYISGEHNERLIFADDFYEVTIYRMDGPSYSIIQDNGHTYSYYVTKQDFQVVDYEEVKLLAEELELPEEAIILNLGKLASQVTNCRYEFTEDDHSVWNVYSEFGLPLGKLYVHDNCSVLNIVDTNVTVFPYYDFIEVDTTNLPLIETSSSEDIARQIKDVYSDVHLYKRSSYNAATLVQAYEDAGFPIHTVYRDGNKYEVVEKMANTEPPLFPYWYVSPENGTLYFVNINKVTTKKSDYAWADYNDGRPYVINEDVVYE